MTGYASAQESAATAGTSPEGKGVAVGRLGLEIRSVNSRFLDLSFRLSEELRQYEPALRELLQGKLKRGKVEVRAGVESTTTDGVRDPGVRLLQRLATMQDTVQAWLPDARPLSVADVVRLATGDSAAGTDWSEAVLAAAGKALTELLASREREGSRLAAMLLSHLKKLRDYTDQARPLIPQLVEQHRSRFLERWKEAMVIGSTDGSAAALPEAAMDRALAEATAFAIRIDVAEELTRLVSHIDEIERLIKKGGEAGKRLDFLIQELHREANTLGSKSAALELTRISVDMKVLIEQMREQVQNIE